MRRTVPVLLLLALAVPLAGADDPDPPTFKGATVAAGPHGPGDQVSFEMSWEDASGVVSMHAYAQGPNNLGVHGYCEPFEPRRVVTASCVLALPAKAPGGEYVLRQVSAQDEVGHHAYVPVEIPFTVDSPFTDVDGPTLVSLEQLVFEIDLEDGMYGMKQVAGVIDIEGADASAVQYAGLNFAGPNGNRGMHVQCEFRDSQSTACDLYADTEIPAGDYVLESVYVADEIGYHSYYAYGAWNIHRLEDILAAPLKVHVASPYGDDQPPVLTDLTFPGRLHRGQPFELRLNATDDSPVESVQVWFQTTRGNAGYYIWHLEHCSGEPAPDRQLVCTGRFPDNFPLGLAIVDWTHVEDHGRNVAWYRPVEWGGGTQSFSDGDRFDVGTILVPRPVEGILESVDAIINEVLPGELATIVYTTRDTVDDVALVLEDAVDGSRLDVRCVETVLTALGNECTFEVPADESGVLFLVEATSTRTVGQETVTQTSTYAAGAVPLLAVTQEIPKSAAMAKAVGGGPLNDVGLEWQAAFESAAARKQAKHDSGTSSSASQGGSGGPTYTGTQEPVYSTDPAPYRNATMAKPVSLRPDTDLILVRPEGPGSVERVDDGPNVSDGQPTLDVPAPWAPLALLGAFALRRRP